MDSEADEIQETGRREQGRGWTSDRWGISEILCQSGNWTQWGDRAQTVGEIVMVAAPHVWEYVPPLRRVMLPLTAVRIVRKVGGLMPLSGLASTRIT